MLIAFITGILGSFHCVGMCGPIAMMLPVADRNSVYARLLYNLGRSVSYAFVGVLIGILGWGVSITGYQQWLSIGIGTLLLIMGLMNFFSADTSGFYIPGLSKQIAILKKQLGKYIQYKTYTGNFILGLLNGLLPCGLVYIALAGALVQGNIINSGLYMFMFGLGTMPLMMLVLLSHKFLSPSIRTSFTKIIPVFTVFVACMIILRGLNLGIPYLSPKTGTASEIEAGKIECHK